MLMAVNDGRRPRSAGVSRSWVFAYDMACPRRARRLRAALASRQVRSQYSVFELHMNAAEHRDLLAEMISHCDLDADALACWAPRRGLQLAWLEGRLRVRDASGMGVRQSTSEVLQAGNALVCYDIRDPDRLRRVAAVLAPWAYGVQRSVYWMRAQSEVIASVLRRMAQHCHSADALWAYPLAHAGDLWRLQSHSPSLLPCGGAPRWGNAP